MKVLKAVFFFSLLSLQSHAQELNCDLLNYYLSVVEGLHFNATHEILWSRYQDAVQESFTEFHLPAQIFGINRDILITGNTYGLLCQEVALLYQFKNSQIPPNEFYEFLISKTIENLDPYTKLLTPSTRSALFHSQDDKEFGIHFKPIGEDFKGPFQVTLIAEGSPASEVNLQVDDIITRMNGTDTSTLDMAQAAKLFTTETDISLDIERAGQKIELTHLIPTSFPTTSIEHHWLNDKGLLYIRIHLFDIDTANDLALLIEKTREIHGLDLKGIILDLRGNLGGYLDQALNVVDLLMDKGTISVTYYKNYAVEVTIKADASGSITQAPLFVLINNLSASASEVVASALQDHGRSLTIGSRSFGKATALTVIHMTHNLADVKISDYAGVLIISSGILHRPTGPSVQQKGVIPDIEIEDPKFTEVTRHGEDKIFYESDLPNSIPAKDLSFPFTPPADSFRNKAKQAITSIPPRTEFTPLENSDPQLFASIDCLHTVCHEPSSPSHFGFTYYYKHPMHKLHINTDLYEPGTALLANFKFYKEYSRWWMLCGPSKKLIYDTYGFLVGNELTLSLENTPVENYVTENKTGFLYVEITVQKKTKDHPEPLIFSHKTIIEF